MCGLIYDHCHRKSHRCPVEVSGNPKPTPRLLGLKEIEGERFEFRDGIEPNVPKQGSRCALDFIEERQLPNPSQSNLIVVFGQS
jgi:hypothetical protein